MSTLLFFQNDHIVDLEYTALIPKIGGTIYLRRWGNDVKWRVLSIKNVRNHVEVDVDWTKEETNG